MPAQTSRRGVLLAAVIGCLLVFAGLVSTGDSLGSHHITAPAPAVAGDPFAAPRGAGSPRHVRAADARAGGDRHRSPSGAPRRERDRSARRTGRVSRRPHVARSRGPPGCRAGGRRPVGLGVSPDPPRAGGRDRGEGASRRVRGTGSARCLIGPRAPCPAGDGCSPAAPGRGSLARPAGRRPHTLRSGDDGLPRCPWWCRQPHEIAGTAASAPARGPAPLEMTRELPAPAHREVVGIPQLPPAGARSAVAGRAGGGHRRCPDVLTHPRLGLALRGGTRIVLEAQH